MIYGLKGIQNHFEIYQSLKSILANRPKLKTGAMIDGYSVFLIDQDHHPKVALHIENEMRWTMKNTRNCTRTMPENPVRKYP